MSEVLSQGEVDALLRGVGEGDVPTETDQPEQDSGAVPFDLTSQDKVIRGRLPTLDIINQMFSRLFRTTFSTFLRKPVDVIIRSTDTVKFSDFLRSLPVPSSLHIFRLEPFRGHSLMVVDSRLVFTVVDTVFGGTGQGEAKITGRDFSAIEIRMIKKVVEAALDDLEKAWKPVHAVTPTYVRSEVNPQFAAIAPPTDVVLAIHFDVDIDSVNGSFAICIPFSSIEPILTKLKAQFQSEELEVDRIWMRRLRAELMDAEVEAVVELGHTDVTPAELLHLKVGDTLMLGNDVTDPLILRIEGIPKVKGYPGASRGKKAIQIEEVIKEQG